MALRGIRDFGIVGQLIIKPDGEGPILALRRKVQSMHPGALEQNPAAYEHESNGIIENGNKLGKGLLAAAKSGTEAGRPHPVHAPGLRVADRAHGRRAE